MPRRVGICVGQNNYSPGSGVTPLKGCINDALLIGELLRIAGYEVTQLHDEAATQAAILSSLEREVARLRAGDLLVFWNSSHGYQVQDTDPTGDELDFKDEAICCYDNNIRDPLTDDKFARILREAHPEAIVLMHCDSCHSATFTRELTRALAGLATEDDNVRSLATQFVGTLRGEPSARVADLEAVGTFGTAPARALRRGGAPVELMMSSGALGPGEANDQPQPRLFIPPRVDGLFALRENIINLDDYVPRARMDVSSYDVAEKPLRRFGSLARSLQESEMRHLLLSGCLAPQVSWDAPFPQGRHGAMTYYFALVVLEAWRKRGEAITYRQAHAQARQRLQQQFPYQDPQLEGPQYLKDLPVFGYDPSAASRVFQVSKTPKETAMLDQTFAPTKSNPSTHKGTTRQAPRSSVQPSSRGAGSPTPSYADGTLLRGPDNSLFVFVGGELLEYADVPRGSLEDLVTAVGVVPQELSDDDLAVIPRGAMPRGIIEDISPDEELDSSMPRRYMQTQARLSQDAGRIDATTRTWTRQPWVGFTGGVAILFGGANGETIGSTSLRQFGVDGFRIPFKQWNRRDHWTEDIDRVLASRVASLTFSHSHAPKSRLQDIVNEAVAVGKTVAETAAAIKQIFG